MMWVGGGEDEEKRLWDFFMFLTQMVELQLYPDRTSLKLRNGFLLSMIFEAYLIPRWWNILYCHEYGWLWTGCGLVVEFIEHLQIVTPSKYRAIANSHPLQFIIAHTKSSQSVFTGRCLVATFSGRRSPYSGFRTIPCLSYQLLTGTAHNYRIAAVL